MKIKNGLKNARGITLIALVITIIVLLILAGISISMLTGQNGILNRAEEAKEETKVAGEEELRKLTQMQAAMSLENTTYTDKSTGEEITVTIPAGFSVSQVEGENTVEDGLVIIDKNGNEFVWVPCTENEYGAPESDWQQLEYSGKEWTDNQSTEIGLKSIKKYGGFYVARYEAGIPENAKEIYRNENNLLYDDITRDKRNSEEVINTYRPISKRNMPVWNFVSQLNAKLLSEKMIEGNEIKSYLIDSYAWNAICRIINKKYGESKSITDSTNWGNYYNNTKTKYEQINTLYAVHQWNDSSWIYATEYKNGKIKEAPRGNGINRLELATGASKDFEVMNIYDLAGNVWEWTTESSNNNAVIRSGSFYHTGNGSPVVRLYGGESINACDVALGFRVVLYLE